MGFRAHRAVRVSNVWATEEWNDLRMHFTNTGSMSFRLDLGARGGPEPRFTGGNVAATKGETDLVRCGAGQRKYHSSVPKERL